MRDLNARWNSMTRRVIYIGFTLSLCLAFAAFVVDTARAQTTTPVTPVISTNNQNLISALGTGYPASLNFAPILTPVSMPGYEPKGLPLGGFRLFPSIDLGTGFDDNVYLLQDNPKGSILFTETPRLELDSQWDRHQLNLYAALTGYQFASLPNEDNIDGTIGGNGRIDILRGIDATGSASYSILHLSNASPLLIQVPTEPTQYAQGLASAAINYHPYHFGVSLGFNYTRLDYGPTDYPAPLGSVSNADLNENIYNPYLRLSYEFIKGFSVFVRGDYSVQQFDQAINRNGQAQNSTGEAINAGLNVQLSHFINGQVFAGYLNQDWASSPPPALSLAPVTGIDYGANLTWTPTVFWTVTLTASRTLNPTVIANASAEDDNVVRLGVDYNLLRNLRIQAHASYWYAEFPGTTRVDQYPEGGIGLTYFLNRNISTSANYDYIMRDTTAPNQNFQDNRFILGINLHM